MSQIHGSVDVVGNSSEVLDLDVGELVETAEIAHVDNVRPEELVARLANVASEHHRSDRPPLDRREGVRNEPTAAKEAVNVSERRLIAIEVDEGNLGMDRDSFREQPF